MSILKLKEAGEELTLNVVTAERVQGDYGEQVKFTDIAGDVLFVPASSVERQLDRCGVGEVEALSGLAIHFSRAANNKKGSAPYWNLDKAREGDVVKKAPTNGKPPVAKSESPSIGRLPGDADTAFDGIVAKFGECLLAVRQEYVPVLEKGGYKVDTANLASMASTLFIERNKKNV